MYQLISVMQTSIFGWLTSWKRCCWMYV